MFRKSRLKIVAVVMSSLVFFLFGTLLVIYGSSYYELSKKNHGMIENYVNSYSLNSPPKNGNKNDVKQTDDAPQRDNRAPNDNKNPPRDNRRFGFQSVDFYSVAVSSDGDILAVDTSESKILTEEDVIAVSEDIKAENKSYGNIGNLVYMVKEKKNYTLIAFMDNSALFYNMKTLLRYTLIYGVFSIIVSVVLSLYLSKQIVKPLEENYLKQKQFISDAGHELKTPVSVVSANADLLARELGDNVWLSNIQYENERMGLLIKQLLELSKTEDAVPQMEPVNLSRIVLGEALPFESVAFEKQHQLKYNIQEELHIMGNTAQIKQLTAILLDNAISHSFPEKEIILNVKEKRKHAVITVINYGKAISKEQQTEIFERFYRLDKVRNSNENHYGLGLAIAKAIVNSHKGKIEIKCYNDKVDFSVYLPLI